MPTRTTLAFAVAAFALGAAFASPSTPFAAQPVQGTPLERLEAVERRLVEVEGQLAALKAAKPAPTQKDGAEQGAKGDQKELDSVLAYLSAQAEAAKRLDERLKESEEKGFTFGINPESRVVLLAAFGEFSATLQNDVPSAKKPQAPASAKR